MYWYWININESIFISGNYKININIKIFIRVNSYFESSCEGPLATGCHFKLIDHKWSYPLFQCSVKHDYADDTRLMVNNTSLNNLKQYLTQNKGWYIDISLNISGLPCFNIYWPFRLSLLWRDLVVSSCNLSFLHVLTFHKILVFLTSWLTGDCIKRNR